MTRVTLAIVLFMVALTSAAQMPGRGSRGGTGTGNPAQRAPVDRMRGNDPGAPTQIQLDMLEDDFKLTETQRPAWYAYADRVQKFADATTRARSEARTQAPASNAVEQLERISQEQHERQATIDEIRELGRTFYATLTPEQKVIADRRLAVPLAAIVSASTVVPETARGAPR